MTRKLWIACALATAFAQPANAQRALTERMIGQRAEVRARLSKQLVGLKFQPPFYNNNTKRYSEALHAPINSPLIGKLITFVETNEPCWLKFKFHQDAAVWNSVQYAAEDYEVNMDFRNIVRTFQDGPRILISNTNWGPYPAALYTDDAVVYTEESRRDPYLADLMRQEMSGRFQLGFYAMINLCRGVTN